MFNNHMFYDVLTKRRDHIIVKNYEKFYFFTVINTVIAIRMPAVFSLLQSTCKLSQISMYRLYSDNQLGLYLLLPRLLSFRSVVCLITRTNIFLLLLCFFLFGPSDRIEHQTNHGYFLQYTSRYNFIQLCLFFWNNF